jgi:hypothetical protein
MRLPFVAFAIALLLAPFGTDTAAGQNRAAAGDSSASLKNLPAVMGTTDLHGLLSLKSTKLPDTYNQQTIPELQPLGPPESLVAPALAGGDICRNLTPVEKKQSPLCQK